MAIRMINGIVPMDADVLMIGVKPDWFDTFQRMVKGGFQSMHMGWSYVANLGESFEDVAKDYIPKRPDLDVIFIANDVGRSRSELESGARMLVEAILSQTYDIKPYIALTDTTDFLKPIFETAGIVAERSDIEALAAERHDEKRRFAERAAA